MKKLFIFLREDFLKVLGSVFLFIPWYIQVGLIDPATSEIDYRNRLILSETVLEIDKNLNNFRLASAIQSHSKEPTFARPYTDLLFACTNSMLVINETFRNSSLRSFDEDSIDPISTEFKNRYDQITDARKSMDTVLLNDILWQYGKYLDSIGSDLKVKTRYYRDEKKLDVSSSKRWFTFCYFFGSLLIAISYVWNRLRGIGQTPAKPRK